MRQNLTHSLVRLSQNDLFRGAFVLAASLVLSSALSAQTPAAPDTQAPAPAATDNPPPAPADNPNGGRGNRGNFNPEEMRARMSAALKERFGVTSDDEWNLIMERINKVNELRRTTMMGGMALRGLFGGPGGPGGPGGANGQGGGRGNRPAGFGAVSNPEADALQTAVTDKAPDAEIKARLERLREVRKTNEATLAKAQEDLRAVLSVRQEAVAVLIGLLP